MARGEGDAGCWVRGRCLFVCYQKPQTALKLLPTARVLVFGFGFRSGIAKVLKWARLRERERESGGRVRYGGAVECRWGLLSIF